MAGSPLGHPAIEAHSSRASRWLRERRLRLALWIAVLEGIVVAVRGDISRWTVVVIAGLVLLVYMALRDRLHWDAGRLNNFLADPAGMFPGLWMSMRGIEDAAEREALVRFLADPASR